MRESPERDGSVGRWAEGRRFARDVAVNVVAGIILAVVIYTFGVAAGYFGTAERWIALVVTVAVLGIGALLVLLFVGSIREMRRREPGKSQIGYGALLALTFAGMYAPVVVSLVFFWVRLT